MKFDFWGKILSNKKIKTDLFAIFITGVILLLVSGSFFSSDESEDIKEEEISVSKTDVANNNAEYDIEKRLSEIISTIEGAGNTKVMVTLKGTTEKNVAKDTRQEKSIDNDESAVSENTVFEETTVSTENAEGEKMPFVISEKMPEIQGALIVSEGADNVYVKSAIVEAAQALLNVPSNKIAVFKMK
mgnify:CR=1 FL=1